MTTPAFRQLIAINTPNGIERNPQMIATTIGVDYRRNQLQQVANDLRNERTLAAAGTSGRPGRVRFAIGLALVDLGTALAGSSRRTSIQAR